MTIKIGMDVENRINVSFPCDFEILSKVGNDE